MEIAQARREEDPGKERNMQSCIRFVFISSSPVTRIDGVRRMDLECEACLTFCITHLPGTPSSIKLQNGPLVLKCKLLRLQNNWRETFDTPEVLAH